jgi:hypothetical protein
MATARLENDRHSIIFWQFLTMARLPEFGPKGLETSGVQEVVSQPSVTPHFESASVVGMKVRNFLATVANVIQLDWSVQVSDRYNL